MIKKVIALILIIIIVGGAGFALYQSKQSKLTARIEIDVAPSVAKVTVNDRKVKIATIKVAPGHYTVKAEMTGFATINEDFTVGAGQSAYFGYALVPTAPNTKDWYSKHPKDQTTAERVSGRRVDMAAQAATTNTPLIKELPRIGPGFEYRIDYGIDPNNKDKTAIFITADTNKGKQDALLWIKSKGFNPDDYTIIYSANSNGE